MSKLECFGEWCWTVMLVLVSLAGAVFVALMLILMVAGIVGLLRWWLGA